MMYYVAEYEVKAEEWKKRKVVRECKIRQDGMIPLNGMPLPMKRSATTEESSTENESSDEMGEVIIKPVFRNRNRSSTENESSDEKGEVIVTPVFGNRNRDSEVTITPQYPVKKAKR